MGNNGTILEYQGSGWTRRTLTGFTTHLNGVWGRGPFEIFAVGVDGTILRRNQDGRWDDLKDLAEQLGGHIDVSLVYLRSLWAFFQSYCGEIADGGTQRQDTSWVIFVGWDSELFLYHDKTICPFGQLRVSRLEGIWGAPPRSEAERTFDGGIECDTVEAVVTGVNGTIVRLVNRQGR